MLDGPIYWGKYIGKYKIKGDKKLSQKISYSKKYYDTINWLENNSENKYIKYQGLNGKGKKRFLFKRLDIDKEEFELKKIIFNRIGFYIEKQNEIIGEEFFFSE